MSSQDSAPAIYQFRIWLRGVSPTIWRRLLVRNDSTITDLHYILQLVMGWTDTHLHTFVIHGKDYGRFCRKVDSNSLLSTISGVFLTQEFQYMV